MYVEQLTVYQTPALTPRGSAVGHHGLARLPHPRH